MNIDPKEKEKFNKIAEEWWDPSGKFAPLHKINPLRANYIAERTELKNKQILDVACGGGLLAEALSLRGGNLSCLLYTSPSPRDRQKSRMPSSA